MTAGDQPPAPGSNWVVRGWHGMRRIAGRALDALPKKTTTAMLVLRLVLVVLAWALIAAIAIEVLMFWALFVLPFQLLARRRQGASAPTPVYAPAAPSYPPPPPTGPPPPPSPLARLATAPDPDPEPATDNCPMCGGPTTDAKAACTYCGSPLPMVAKRGWHPDPLGGLERRWYDGSRWSEHTKQPD